MYYRQVSRPQRTSWDLFKEFEELFGQLNAEPATPAFAPQADIRENEKGYLMAFDLPGLRQEDVKIEVKDSQLTLSGERRRENANGDHGFNRTERRFGKFLRSFTLPNDVNPSQIEAQFENGELQLFLPKSEAAKPVQIQVKSQTPEVKGLVERFFSPRENTVNEATAKH